MIRLGSLARFLVSVLFILPSVAAVRHVSAAELYWQAPVGCPGREIVEHRISVAIGMPLDQVGNGRFKCKVIKSTNGLFRLKLRVEIPEAHADDPPRVIEADTCERVADTAVVAIALALGANSVTPTQSGTEDAASDSQPPEAESNVSVTDQTKRTEEPVKKSVSSRPPNSPSPSSNFWAAAQLGPVVDLGSLPGLALGIEPAFDLGYRNISARLSGTVFSSKRATLSDGSGAEFSMWSIALSACGNTPRERTHATLCVRGQKLGR